MFFRHRVFNVLLNWPQTLGLGWPLCLHFLSNWDSESYTTLPALTLKSLFFFFLNHYFVVAIVIASVSVGLPGLELPPQSRMASYSQRPSGFGRSITLGRAAILLLGFCTIYSTCHLRSWRWLQLHTQNYLSFDFVLLYVSLWLHNVLYFKCFFKEDILLCVLQEGCVI